MGDVRANLHQEGLIVSIDLSADEQADIAASLKTLTDKTLLCRSASDWLKD